MNGSLGVSCARCQQTFAGTEPAVYVALSRSLFHRACYPGAAGAPRADRSSASILEAVLAALPGETAIIDAAGTIVQVNEAWATAAKSDHALAVGANYLDACGRAADVPAGAAREVLGGVRDELAFEYQASRHGQDRWLEVRVRHLARLGGGAVVMRFDVTARRQAQATIQVRRHDSCVLHYHCSA